VSYGAPRRRRCLLAEAGGRKQTAESCSATHTMDCYRQSITISICMAARASTPTPMRTCHPRPEIGAAFPVHEPARGLIHRSRSPDTKGVSSIPVLRPPQLREGIVTDDALDTKPSTCATPVQQHTVHTGHWTRQRCDRKSRWASCSHFQRIALRSPRQGTARPTGSSQPSEPVGG
jgi:hypothetical protein